jgi:hypothetical protein
MGKQKPKGSKKYVLLGGGILFLLAIVMIGHSLSSPAEGSIKDSAPVSSAPAKAPGQVRTDGKYISFVHRDDIKQVPADQPGGNELEVFNLVRKPWPYWYLNIGISRLPSGNIADDGSYNMRALNPGRYKLEHWSLNSTNVAVFSDLSGGYSKAAFVSHGDKLLTAAISSDDAAKVDQLDAALKQVLTSVEWR